MNWNKRKISRHRYCLIKTAETSLKIGSQSRFLVQMTSLEMIHSDPQHKIGCFSITERDTRLFSLSLVTTLPIRSAILVNFFEFDDFLNLFATT